MAIQNFIGGGFKGKLGATIGQGWKNKKVIRSNFVPANPRTQKQMANRNDFSVCVKMAQLAMQMNFRCPGFQSDSNTEWALRISSARNYFDKTKADMYCIPILPYGTVAKYAVSDDFDVSGSSITFYIDTEDDIAGRGVSVLLYLKKTGTEEYEYFVLRSTVAQAAQGYSFSVSIPAGFEVASNSLACAVSNDDTVLGETIYRSPLSVFNPVVDIPFTLSSPFITPISAGATKRVITFTPSTTLASASPAITGVTAQGVLQGSFETLGGKVAGASASSVTIELDTDVLDSLNQLAQFPSGSSVTIPAFSFTVGESRYVYAGGTFSISETTVQQNAVPYGTSTEVIGNQTVIRLFKDTPSAITGGNRGTLSAPVYDSNGSKLSGTLAQYGVLSSDKRYGILVNTSAIYAGSPRTLSVATSVTATVNGVDYVMQDFTIPITLAGDTLELNLVSTGDIYIKSNVTTRLIGYYTDDDPSTMPIDWSSVIKNQSVDAYDVNGDPTSISYTGTALSGGGNVLFRMASISPQATSANYSKWNVFVEFNDTIINDADTGVEVVIKLQSIQREITSF